MRPDDNYAGCLIEEALNLEQRINGICQGHDVHAVVYALSFLLLRGLTHIFGDRRPRSRWVTIARKLAEVMRPMAALVDAYAIIDAPEKTEPDRKVLIN